MKSIQELEKDIDATKNCFNYNSENRKKPFECLFCGKDYTSRGIDRHLSYAHGIVRFDFGIRECRIETLKEVLKLIDELKNNEGVRARYHEKTIINMCEYIKQRITEGERSGK